MIRIYKCGHEAPIGGMWKDDFWFRDAKDCPACRRKQYSRPTVKIEVRTQTTLVIEWIVPRGMVK